MSALEGDKLVLFVLFVIPGFVSLRTYDLLYPAERIDGLRRAVEAISYSCINYAVLSPFLIAFWPQLIDPQLSELISIPMLIGILFVAPAGLAFLWRYLRLRLAEKGIIHHPIGRSWDFVFQKQPACWIKIYLKDDGGVIGGYYGSNSFASSSPEPQDIFLQEAWKINEAGGFEKMKTRSTGVLVKADVVSHIEFRSIEN